LSADKARVGAALRRQIAVRPALDDRALLHHADEVGVLDRGKPMSDHQRRSVLGELRERVLYEPLGVGVEGAGGLIEKENRSITQNGCG